MKETFLKLYDNYFDDVYRYVAYKTGNRWDADDIVSDIFRKAFENISSLKDSSNGKAWLMTISRNAVADFYRRKKDTVQGDILDLIPGNEIFEDRFETADDIECLKKVIAYLPPEDQEMIQMKYFAEMKFKEISDVLDKKLEAVKTRTFRLLKKMKVLLERCLEGDEKVG